MQFAADAHIGDDERVLAELALASFEMDQDITFENPPVVETVLGIQFDRLPGLTNAHLGAFWQQIGTEWRQVSDAPRLEDQFELFDQPRTWGRTQLSVTQDVSTRIMARNKDSDRMVQLQNCRLHYNWIKKADEPYPRYTTVRPEFDRVLEGFKTFVQDSGLGQLTPNQWEVTYVNHILKGPLWESPEQWWRVFSSLLAPVTTPSSLLAPVTTPGQARLDGFGGHWHFEIMPQRGRLHVELEHGRVGSAEGPEAIVMKLTARGPIDKTKASTEAIDDGLNFGHEAIVTSFFELTSELAHEQWRIVQ